MPNVIGYQRGPSEGDRRAAQQISASRRESLTVLAILVLIATLTVLHGLFG